MRRVSTDAITNGAVAAADVCSPSGQVLLNSGAPITPAMGKRLRNWGIAHVFIEGLDDSEQNAVAEAVSPVQIKSGLYDMFLGTLDSPYMTKIFNAMCEHKLRKGGVR
jgi:hypothetical protein